MAVRYGPKIMMTVRYEYISIPIERVPLPIVDILVWELQCGDTNHTNTTGVACLEYVYLMKLATASCQSYEVSRKV
jgi:hypothetical protein